MRLKELQELWHTDSKIDRSELGNASTISDRLHSKYLNHLSTENVLLLKEKRKLNKLLLEKHTFYTQGPSKEQIDKGWKLPAKGVIIKADVHRYLDADDDIADLTFRIGYQVEKIEFLKSVLKTIERRSFTIGNALKDLDYKAGNG